MRPDSLHAKIFLDSGDPAETEMVLDRLGFLDGQTTNPSLIAKNPAATTRLAQGLRFRAAEVAEFYQDIIRKIARLLPEGSISIEVYADARTPAEEMLAEGRKMSAWIPNAQIKYPITAAGLAAAAESVRAGLRVNLTLCFASAQAAAVYAATQGAAPGQAYISPFIGRLDDRGENGIDLIRNIVHLYRPSDGHVSVLAASIRTVDHLLASISGGADIITAPAKVLLAWAEQGLPLPGADYIYRTELKPIGRPEVNLVKNWKEYDIRHELTERGLEKFVQDWNALVSQER